MSSSRNKRKRTDAADLNNTSATTDAMVANPTTEGSRSGTALGDEPNATTKNEGETTSNATASNTNGNTAAAATATTPAVAAPTNASNSSNNIGESSSHSEAPKQQQQPLQHETGSPLPPSAASAVNSASATAVPTEQSSSGEGSQELSASKKEEMDAKKNETGSTAGSTPVAATASATPNINDPPPPSAAAPPPDPASSTPINANNAAPEPSNSTAATAVAVQPQVAESTSTRESRIKSMISHRKILLDRARSSRYAVQSRMQLLAKNDTRTAKGAGEPQDESEIAAFKRLGRIASQAAKKQKSDAHEAAAGGLLDKRTSVSLRRGSSVGKKMNAALSSLVPGHSAGASAAAAVESSSALPLHLAATTKADMTAKTHAHAALANPAPSSQNLIAPAMAAAAPKPLHPQSASLQAGPKSEIYVPQQTANRQGLKGAGTTKIGDSVTKANRGAAQLKTAAAGIPTSIDTSGPISIANPMAAAAVLGQPLHTDPNAPPGIPSPNNSHKRRERAPVIFHQAIALRDRRSMLLSQLEQNRKAGEKRKREHSVYINGSVAADLHQSHGKDSYSPRAAGQLSKATDGSKAVESVDSSGFAMISDEVLPKSDLPRRRKTHWDNLLEEMHWMATDFIEERKWKQSAARTIGSSIMLPAVMSAKKTAAPEVAVAPKKEAAPPDTATDTTASNSTTKGDSSTVVTKAPTPVPTASAPEAEEEGKTQMCGPYRLPTNDDSVACKEAAKTISSVANGMGWVLQEPVVRAPPMSSTNSKSLQSALQSITGDQSQGLPPSPAAMTRSNATRGRDSEESKLGSFVRISKAVDSLLEKINDDDKSSSKKRASNSNGDDHGDILPMMEEQDETVDFIKELWSYRAGAILTGSKASGKTVAVCSLLQRQEVEGLTLVVCSPFRVMKWMHELDRCTDLHITIFDANRGFRGATPNSEEGPLGKNGILVCDFSDFRTLKALDLDRFQTIVVDSRYPRGFLGSRFSSALEQDKQSTGIRAPKELLAKSWWANLVERAAKASLNFLLIENPGETDSFLDSAKISEMQSLELVALRTALIMGPHIFSAPSSSVLKRVLTWARRKAQENNEATKNKMKEVRKYLLETSQSFCFDLKNSFLENTILFACQDGPIESEIRFCSLSSAERSEYESCCTALRGALSSNVIKCEGSMGVARQTLHSVSDALLRLRRQCIHSRLSALMQTKTMQTRAGPFFAIKREGGLLAGNSSLCKNLKDSPSQTDSELASEILSGSAKLRELVSMLRSECHYNVEGLDTIVQNKQTTKGTKRTQSKTPKNVVVLAVLPEVQILVSILMHCLGIGHGFLMLPSVFFGLPNDDFRAGLPERQTSELPPAWRECQERLLQFNSLAASKDSVIGNLLITSPEIIAGDHGGIGIEAADFVISIDDDWSGRNEMLMRSLMASLIPRNQLRNDQGCHFVSLVCEETCEAQFLSPASKEAPDSPENALVSNSWPWGFDAFGRFLATKPSVPSIDGDSCWPSRGGQVEGFYAFPAQNLFPLRDQSLAEVLAVKGLPPSIEEGSSNLFLPRVGDKDSRIGTAEIDLVVHLISAEDKARATFEAFGVLRSTSSSHRMDTVVRQDMPATANEVLLGNRPQQAIPSVSQTEKPGRGISATREKDVTCSEVEKSNHQRPWHKAEGIKSCTVDSARWLLHYKPSSEKETVHCSTSHRSKSSTHHGDGKEGTEALVYLPPRLQGAPHLSAEAQHIVGGVDRRRSGQYVDGVWTPKGPKRMAEGADDTEAKRFKSEDSLLPNFDLAETPIPNGAAATVDSDLHSPHDDALSFDLNEDLGDVDVGDQPVPDAVTVPPSTTGSSREVSFPSLDPDELLLMCGIPEHLVPCDTEELEELRALQKARSLDAVVLVVAGKISQVAPLPATLSASIRPATTTLEAPWAAHRNQLSASTSSAIPRPGSGVFQDMNGSRDSVTLMKQKSTTAPMFSPVLPTAAGTTPFPMTQVPVNFQISTKAIDLHRDKIFAFLSGKQKSMGTSMFESSQYGLAVVRFKNRVVDRMQRQSSALESSLKMDDAVQPSPMKDEAARPADFVETVQTNNFPTEADAKSLAEKQRSSLRLSSGAPLCVDFGPFSGGFLLSSTGLATTWPPVPRDGVSLPMGVKVPQLPSQPQHSHPWTKEEDRSLHDFVSRFGMNWILAARSLSGFDDVDKLKSNGSVGADSSSWDDPCFRRTPRECRERWQALLLVDSSIETSGAATGGSKADGATTTTTTTTTLCSPPLHDGGHPDSNETIESTMSLLCAFDSKQLNAAGGLVATDKNTESSSDRQRPKKDFAAFLSSETKRQVVPVTIPGATPGSQPTFVASHPSHLDAVHSSVAASWTSGRTEMWPLQFLDVAEKQRTARAAASASAAAAPPPSTHTVSPMTTSGSTLPAEVGTSRGAPPAKSARAMSRPHTMPAPNSAVYSHSHPASLGQPYPSSSMKYPPPRQGGNPYPPQLAAAPSRSPPQHRVEPPHATQNAARGPAPQAVPPKPVSHTPAARTTNSGANDKASSPNTAPRPAASRTAGASNSTSNTPQTLQKPAKP